MNTLRTRTALATATLGSALLVAAPAQAQALQDHFWMEAGAYFPHIDTDIKISSKTANTIGTQVDLEDDLGLKDSATLPEFRAGARISGRFAVVVDYFSLGRSGSKTIAKNITIDDVVYPAAASISTSFDSDVYRLTLNYSFIKHPNFELGAALGAHVTDFAVKVAGQGSVGGAAAAVQTRRRTVLAPLPTLGLYAVTEIAPKLSLGARIDYLELKIDDYHGRLINAQASLTYRILKNVGIGAAYRLVDYQIRADKTDWTGQIDYKFNGPTVFLQFGF